MYRRRVHEEEEDDDHPEMVPRPVNNSVEMPFVVIFPKSPSQLMSAKLPARVVIKGHVTSLGRSSVIKVDRYAVKKSKI